MLLTFEEVLKGNVISYFWTYSKLLLQWVGLSFPNYAIYLDSCRECYEAYVKYSPKISFFIAISFSFFLLGNL